MRRLILASFALLTLSTIAVAQPADPPPPSAPAAGAPAAGTPANPAAAPPAVPAATPPSAAPSQPPAGKDPALEARRMQCRAEFASDLAEMELESHQRSARLIATNERHVILAYAALWVLAVGFLVYQWQRQRELDRRIHQLQRDLDAATRDDKGPKGKS